MMVSRRRVGFGVALQAEPIAGHTQLGAMRPMSMTAMSFSIATTLPLMTEPSKASLSP
jgi:hypothetical protein